MVNTSCYDLVTEEAKQLAIRKNADYSGSKIDNISLTGVNGISVRLLDKVSRVYNLSSGKPPEIKNESMRDTFIDIVNYAIFAIMMIDGTWASNKDATAPHWRDIEVDHTTVNQELPNDGDI